MSSRIERVARMTGRYYVWAPALFGVCFVAGYFLLSSARPHATDTTGFAATTTADERLFIYVGSSTCGPSNADDLPAVIARLRSRVQESARRDDRRFVAVGIAKDVNVRAGLTHLAKYGHFDEVTSGRSWANIGVVKYIQDLHGPGATPQVLVVDRHLHDAGTFVEILRESVLVRRVGLQELREWASQSKGAL